MRVCFVTYARFCPPEALAAASGGHDVTVLCLEDVASRSDTVRIVRLAHDEAYHGFHDLVVAHRAYVWLKGRAFDEIRFNVRRGAGFFCVLAKQQGLAFNDTKLTVVDDDRSLAALRRGGGLRSSVDDLLREHMETTSARPIAPTAPDAEPPFVSVCLVHHDRPALLRQAVGSLYAQDTERFEVILVDDGSTSPAALAFLDELAPEFERRGWQIHRQENRYLGAARNAAARLARGEYLLFMDDDNLAKPHEVSTFARVAARTGADLLTCQMELFEGDGPPVTIANRFVFTAGPVAAGALINCFGDANALVRRSVFESLGGFTEDRGIGHEDWELFARAALAGAHLETVPEALFYYRIAKSSMRLHTSRAASHLRSLRPYLAQVPDELKPLLEVCSGMHLERVDAAASRSQLRRRLDAAAHRLRGFWRH